MNIEPHSPFKRTYKVNFKQHDVIQKLYEKNANSTVKILDKMQQQPDRGADGKRLFLDKTNMSNTMNMYPVLEQD